MNSLRAIRKPQSKQYTQDPYSARRSKSEHCVDEEDYTLEALKSYKHSRTRKLINMFMPIPVTIEQFKSEDNSIETLLTGENKLQELLVNNEGKDIFADLYDAVINYGSAVLAYLPIKVDGKNKHKFIVSHEYKYDKGSFMKSIYIKYMESMKVQLLDKNNNSVSRNANIYLKYDVEKKSAIPVGSLEQTSSELKYMTVDKEWWEENYGTYDFTGCSFEIFSFNNDEESLFAPIEEQGKKILNSLNNSFAKEIEVSTSGLILEDKKFDAGAGGAEDMIKGLKKWKNTIVKFVMPKNVSQYQSPIQQWNPQPKTEIYQKNIMAQEHKFDEDIGMHRAIGSDGKSNNKTAGQTGQYGTPSYNLLFKFLMNMDLSLNLWKNRIISLRDQTYTIGLQDPIKHEINSLLVQQETNPQTNNQGDK